jgi:hypothetical protein
MMRSFLASKTAKLVAACVCPVAGTGALTVAVPQVRSAVHKATGPTKPRAYAAPKTRVRTAAGSEPCAEAPAVMMNSPLSMLSTPTQSPVADATDGASTTPPVKLAGTTGRNPQVPLDIGNGGGGGGVTPAVPEVTTWVQMIVGFGLVGGVVRKTVSRNADTELA